MGKYVALLRGINVGGNNIIKMADLKACFEASGFEHVTTFIQSGNVVFEAYEPNRTKLTQKIESILAKTFSYKARIVLCSHTDLQKIIAAAPPGFGANPSMYRSYVLFLKEPLTAAMALPQIPLRDGVDTAWAGPGVLFHQRLEAKATQSYLNKLVAMPIYQDMTIRNWNTTTKLLAILEKM